MVYPGFVVITLDIIGLKTNEKKYLQIYFSYSKGLYHQFLASPRRARNAHVHVPTVAKIVTNSTKTVYTCVWLEMAMMEMASNLKSSGRLFFQVFARVSDKIGKTDFCQFFFHNSFKFVSLVV